MLLLTNYREKGDLITFPCILQEKVDGVRCLIRNGKGISRSGKEFKNIEHILNELQFVDSLDGELWCEDMTLYEISGLLNKKKLDKRDQQKMLKIKLYVFDIKMPGTFKVRMVHLGEIKIKYTFENIKFISNIECKTREEGMLLVEEWISKGKEGGVFRNLNGLYINGRSCDVQKYKSRYDEEFKIIGYEETENGSIIWKCITERGFTFSVRNQTKGIINPEEMKDKMLTVQYMLKDPITEIPREAISIGFK